MLKPIRFMICVGLLNISQVWASSPINLPQYFQHEDWEIACSNTGICRAAGYNSDEKYLLPASILLVRHAGQKQTITAKVALSHLEDEAAPIKNLNNLQLYLNGISYGAIKFNQTSFPLVGALSSAQTQSLLKFANKSVNIEIKNSQYQWQISDKGMTAALLKMDDVQKRIGTTGALVKKGHQLETNVLAAKPKLTVKPIKTITKPSKVLHQNDQSYHVLQQRLLSHTTKDTACMSVEDINENFKDESIEIYPLNQNKVLAKTLCWQGAYNRGYGVWIMDKDLKSNIQLITDAASEFTAGTIDSAQKGRGLGDCWSISQWVWNGNAFIQTLDRTTGMCKGFMGGAWELDLIESLVK